MLREFRRLDKLAEDPYSSCYDYRGVIYEAESELSTAIRYAEYYYKQGKYKKALDILESAIDNVPDPMYIC